MKWNQFIIHVFGFTYFHHYIIVCPPQVSYYSMSCRCTIVNNKQRSPPLYFNISYMYVVLEIELYMYTWHYNSFISTVMLHQLSGPTVMYIMCLNYFYNVKYRQKNTSLEMLNAYLTLKNTDAQTWNTFKMNCYFAVPFLNQAFSQSASWHQNSWSEADTAPFPGWRVPGAVPRDHGLCRRARPCGKGQQRYTGHLTDLYPSLHSIIHEKPWIRITIICTSALCSHCHSHLTNQQSMTSSVCTCSVSIMFPCSFGRDTPEEPWAHGPSDQDTGERSGNLPSSTKRQGPVCGEDGNILFI